jgi:TonB family protein
MTRPLWAVFAVLLLFAAGGARADALASLSPHLSNFQPAGQTQQSPELDEARELNRKVVEFYQAGKFEEALPLAKRVLQLREQALGKDHQLVSEALINLAELYLAKKSYREALSFYERLLKINEKVAGQDDASNTVLLDKLGFLRYLTGDFKGAENSYSRSLALSEKISGAESEQAAQAAFNLAELYRFTNSYQKAEPLYRRALPVLEKTLGADHTKLVGLLESYACLLSRLKKEDESAGLLKRAGEMRTRLINERLKAKGSQPVQGDKFPSSEIISKPPPVYPEEARRRRMMGEVTVRVTIDEVGKVIRVCGVGGDPLLMRSAEQAAMKARFHPLMLEGIPVETTTVIFYRFWIR